MKRGVLAVLLIAGLSMSMTVTGLGVTPAFAQPPTLTVTKCAVDLNGVPLTGCTAAVYAAPGDVVVYQICVTNNGPGPATGVVVTDNLAPFQTSIASKFIFAAGTIPQGVTVCAPLIPVIVSTSTLNGQQIYNQAFAAGTNTNVYASNVSVIEVSGTPPPTVAVHYVPVLPPHFRVCLGIHPIACGSV